METRRIGSLEVSVVGLGCNQLGGRLDDAASAAVVHGALDAGVTFFDTADIYGGDGRSEEALGKALAGRRDEAVVCSKFGMAIGSFPGGGSPEYVRTSVEGSLRRLGVDVIDLYLLHSPDPDTPIADTLAAMDELVRAGTVREIGCSNFSVDQLRAAAGAVKDGAAAFVSVQNEYSLLQREADRGVLEECRRQGITFLPYFPLASGLLAGTYRPGEPAAEGTRLANPRMASRFANDRNVAIVEELQAFASARGHSLLELAIGWLLARDQVASVIAGASRPEQVQANVAAGTWTLTADEVAQIDAIAPVEAAA